MEPLQPIQSNTANLNRIGFAAEKEAAQPQVSLETPKDDFVKKEQPQALAEAPAVKKESHAVGIGAAIGAGLSFCRGFSLIGVVIAGGIGAGIGAIYNHFAKKD